MRALALILGLIFPVFGVLDGRAQTAPAKKALPPTPVTKSAAPQATVAPAATTQAAAPWKAILRVVPNPLPAGRCATAAVEMQDPDGYRATSLSNGGVIDFHQFVYKSSDVTAFNWQDGNPVFGIICAPATSIAAQTVVTVTLPDGLTSSVTLTTVAPTARVASVQYPPQAKLRPGSLPPPVTTVSTVPVTQASTVPETPTASLATVTPIAVGAGAAAVASGDPPIGVGDRATDATTPWSGTLTLDNTTMPAQLISGGVASVSVVQGMNGPNRIKYGGAVSFSPIVVSVQPSQLLADWANAAWGGLGYQLSTKSGVINVSASSSPSIARHIAFANATLKSIRFPALPIVGKANGITITLVPTVVTNARPSAPTIAIQSPSIASALLTVAGLSGGTRVASFEVISATPATPATPGSPASPAQPAIFPNIIVTLDEQSSSDWVAWYKDAVFNGNSSQGSQRTADLYLYSASSAVIASIKMGVGLVALRSTTVAGQKPTLEAELFVSVMEFHMPGA